MANKLLIVLLNKLIVLLITLFLIANVLFILVRIVPEDPMVLYFPRGASPEVLEEWRFFLGLNAPIRNNM